MDTFYDCAKLKDLRNFAENNIKEWEKIYLLK